MVVSEVSSGWAQLERSWFSLIEQLMETPCGFIIHHTVYTKKLYLDFLQYSLKCYHKRSGPKAGTELLRGIQHITCCFFHFHFQFSIYFFLAPMFSLPILLPLKTGNRDPSG